MKSPDDLAKAPAVGYFKGMARPTDFKPEYGPMILDLMSEGLSLTAAAAAIGIHRERVYDWVKKHDEFAHTVKLAQSMRVLWLEQRLYAAETGPKVTSTIFALKNADHREWRERQEVDHSSSDGSMSTPTTIRIVGPVDNAVEDE